MSSNAAQSRPAPTPLSRIDAHYRKFLATRWLEFTWRAGVWTALVLGTSLFILTGFRLSVLPAAFALGLAIYPFTVYPILWARRGFVTSPPAPPMSNSLLNLAAITLFNARTLRFLATYVTGGVLFAVSFCQLLTLWRPSVELGLFTPTPRHPWHLNERFIFVILGDCLFLTAMGLRDVYGGHLRAVWPKRKLPFGKAVQNTILASLPTVDHALTTFNPLTVSVGSSAFFSLAYFTLRSTVWRFVLTHFGGLLRGFVINFARSSRNTVTWSLLPLLLLLESTFLVALQLPAIAMMAYITQPLNFKAFTAKSPLTPDRYLLTALQSQNAYYINFTLMELLRVCRDPQRRKAIFEDVSKTPTLTSELWQSLTRILERSQETLMTRGGTRSIESAPPKSSAPPNPDPRAIPIKQGDIFRPIAKKRSTVETMVQSVLDGPGKPPVHSVVPLPIGNALLKVTDKAKSAEAKAIEDTKQSLHATLVNVKKSETVKAIENGKVGQAGKVLVQDVVGTFEAAYESLSGLYVERYLGALPNRHNIQWVIDIITVLAVASTEEDIYGHVQRLLPSTFDTVLRLRQGILAFQSELSASPTPNRSQKLGITAVQNELDLSVAAIENGLRRICGKFGNSMTAFKLPATISATLSDICK